MENETKYSLIVVVVAAVALVAFNFNDIATGQIITKNTPTTFKQESLNLVRSIDIVPNPVSNGGTVTFTIDSTNRGDLIQKGKEKILIYNSAGRIKKQLDRPKCLDTESASCSQAEKTYAIPYSWENGEYKVQIEREAREDGKYIKEVVGRAYLTIN